MSLTKIYVRTAYPIMMGNLSDEEIPQSVSALLMCVTCLQKIASHFHKRELKAPKGPLVPSHLSAKCPMFPGTGADLFSLKSKVPVSYDRR